MRIFKKLMVIGLLAGLVLPLATAQDKVTLEYKFKEGQTIYLLAVVQGQVSIQLPESVQQGAMPTAFPLSVATIISMKTLKTYSDGAADIELGFLEGKMYLPGQEIPLSTLAQQQGIPQTIRIRMGKKGNIIKLLTPLPTQQISTTSPFGLDPNMLIQNLSQFAILPEQEVGVGDKWEVKLDTDLSPFGKLKLLQKLTLTSFEKVGNRDCAKIAIEVPPSNLQFNIPLAMPGAVPTEGQEVPTLPINGQLEMKGDMLFDPQNGYIVSQTGALKMLLNMTMPGPGAQGQAFQMLININMKFKVSSSEKKPTLPTSTQIQQILQPSQPQEGQA